MSRIKARAKGARVELEAINLLKEAGVPAVRVPLSGHAGGQFGGDIAIGKKRYEVKARNNGFKQLYQWLKGVDGLIVKGDREVPLAVIPLADYAALLADKEWDRI